ncbi:hypothetical protein L198_08299 [Cryptococcus wingfieldii CBS 7118]|uniref:Uncharacterized protein n=1 Tax=Cryptococcus wingfieldii CBS 7118 TaxID=1295528 RepID=A0A1E3H9U1_9TREE|nr:hypothetical protein L198_08299 [Cryptococcus wingfieldii CBS 7118]ODN73108.1 hypothetical protein L198_08299 [Cryptococcus wingfieldii CBS 7118]
MADPGPSTNTGEPTPAPQPVQQTPASINALSEIFGFINHPDAAATAARAGSTQRKGTKASARLKGKAPAVPPPSKSSVPNAYPAGLGHSANQGLGGPLALVPFDLTIHHRYPNGLTIKPYKDVDQDWMGSVWTSCYHKIPGEPGFQADHVVLYLREFCFPPKTVYKTSWRTDVDFSQDSFYLEKEYTDLEIVQSVRDHDTEVKGSKLSSLGTSKAASVLSMKLGATKPDVCLTGYHNGNLAEETCRKEPAGGGNLEDTDRPLEALYAIIELKWVPWPGESRLNLRNLDLHLNDLDYANMEAITQTIFYSLLGYDVSKCRSAMALVNGDYTRIMNLSDLVPEGEEAVLGGMTLGGGGGRRILVEADPDVVNKLRYHKVPCLSPEQFGELAAGVSSLGIQWKAPNSLIANYENWALDVEAKERLDATVYLNLALATHHPEAVQDSRISNHPLTNVIGANTSKKEAYQWLDVGVKRVT